MKSKLFKNTITTIFYIICSAIFTSFIFFTVALLIFLINGNNDVISISRSSAAFGFVFGAVVGFFIAVEHIDTVPEKNTLYKDYFKILYGKEWEQEYQRYLKIKNMKKACE